ncbi:MAG TPA: hypothetical protein VFF73_21635 [Planctomycetota bacterium]|nr:hypothetical protein [Planctomycetota bacterium]
MRVVLVLVLVLGCSSDPSQDDRPADPPRRAVHKHTWDDDEIMRIDHPELAPPPKQEQPAQAPRPKQQVAKLTVSVYDVISWDDVKIRGGIRNSPVVGIVSLTGWLKTAKGTSKTELSAPLGREAEVVIDDALKELVTSYATIRVAVLDVDEKGELDVNVTGLAGAEKPEVVPATRIHLTPGEALVIGGHRSETDETPKKKDRLAILEVRVGSR